MTASNGWKTSERAPTETGTIPVPEYVIKQLREGDTVGYVLSCGVLRWQINGVDVPRLAPQESEKRP